jgi:hypothetical protein
MKTIFLVMAEFDSAEIPLEKLLDHFGSDLPNAKRKAAGHDLPVPFYKKAGKGAYFCKATDWADYIDHQSASAKARWQQVNNKAQQGVRA